MKKRDEIEQPGSCLNKAGADEPIFVIRAKDKIAARVVRAWATAANGVHEPAKIKEAFAFASDMEAWRRANVTEEPAAKRGGRTQGTKAAKRA